jgi:hypothetical protein
MKREPDAWGYNCATLSLGDINTRTGSSMLGMDARLMTLLCKNITVTKSKEMKTRCNLAESSEANYCLLKKGCFADDDDYDIN